MSFQFYICWIIFFSLKTVEIRVSGNQDPNSNKENEGRFDWKCEKTENGNKNQKSTLSMSSGLQRNGTNDLFIKVRTCQAWEFGLRPYFNFFFFLQVVLISNWIDLCHFLPVLMSSYLLCLSIFCGWRSTPLLPNWKHFYQLLLVDFQFSIA